MDETLTESEKNLLRCQIVASARELLGVPYQYGFEWKDYSKKPPFLDCSEDMEGVFVENKFKMPDGAQNQFNFTVPTGKAKPADLAFFARGQNPAQIYHVGMLFDEFNIIECRQFDPKASFETGKVILRPRFKWETYPTFMGYRSHPKLL